MYLPIIIIGRAIPNMGLGIQITVVQTLVLIIYYYKCMYFEYY